MTTPAILNRQNTTSTSLDGVYFPKPGQSIFDVCLQLYGSLDGIISLMVANGFSSPNNESVAGSRVNFDLTKAEQSLLYKYNKQFNILYATGELGRVIYPMELREDGSFELREDGGKELR